ncbi:Heparanase-like protein [Melia azedarach]|uniref:Heparanase-like protein n=1 Tax=Melia azedarach TaxID=155640 RepID=A0ACC1XP51_MELAZ|nr:Heparanase-like protein [Melia azedarach]
MGTFLYMFLFLVSLPAIWAQQVTRTSILVDGTKTVATNDENFICATVDWWPHDKCDYNQCPWGNSSVLNLDLSHPLLAKAIQAFKRLRIRVGGSLQDQVLYDVGNLKAPCHPFGKMKDGLFGFSKGCLHMERWDELNQLLNRTGAIVTFGLNALHGRHHIKDEAWGGDWDSGNAYDLIKYTISKGHQIDSWEFGNELSGKGIGANVNADLYGKDVSGSNVVNVVTHHIYNLGAGVDPNLVSKILDPRLLEQQSGGAYNSGGRQVSNTFVNSFWYLDQLGMASMYNTKVYCRQTLIGGNYALLNTTTFVPNPDYYSALLWHRLIGKGVLSVATDSSPFLRSYAHCSKGRGGITLLLINLSNQTDYIVSVQNKKAVAWVGGKASDEHLTREEYHLTPKDGHLQSQTMVLNGNPVELTEDKSIPRLDPVHVNVNSPISIAPLSIAFVVFPNFDAPACA